MSGEAGICWAMAVTLYDRAVRRLGLWVLADDSRCRERQAAGAHREVIRRGPCVRFRIEGVPGIGRDVLHDFFELSPENGPVAVLPIHALIPTPSAFRGSYVETLDPSRGIATSSASSLITRVNRISRCVAVPGTGSTLKPHSC